MKYYFIVIKGNRVSESYYKMARKEFLEFNLGEPTVFNAVTPKTGLRDERRINFGIKRSVRINRHSRPFTSTEKAIYFSHLYLWDKIIEDNEPAWIFEHDVCFEKLKNLPEPFEEIDFLSLGEGILWAYYITPRCASYLRDKVLSGKMIVNADGFVEGALRRNSDNGHLNCVLNYIGKSFYCRQRLGKTIAHH